MGLFDLVVFRGIGQRVRGFNSRGPTLADFDQSRYLCLCF